MKRNEHLDRLFAGQIRHVAASDGRLGITDEYDLNRVAKLLSDGKQEEALDAAYQLDTYVRDFIPKPAWDYLNGRAGVITLD